MNKHITYYLFVFLLIHSLLAFGQSDSTAVVHTVQLGDNLYKISLKYGIQVDQIKDWNNLTKNVIREGQKLIVGYQTDKSGQAQQSLNTSEHLLRLREMVDRVEALYYESLAAKTYDNDSTLSQLINDLFGRDYSEVSKFELLKQLNETRIEALKNDIGLGFYSSATHNFRPGVFDGEDLLFQNRANFGLDWRVLSGGLAANKDAVSKLEIENELNRILQVKDAKSNNYVYAYNYIIYLFNQAQQRHLKRRLSLLDNFFELASQMYLVRAMSWEKLVDLKGKKGALENMQKNLTNYNKGFDSAYSKLLFDRSIDAEKLPVLEVVPDRVFSGVGMDSMRQRTLALQKQRLEIDYKRSRDFNLRTYVRYNLFDSEDADLRTFGSIGATFTAPLFRNKKNEELKQKELAVLQSQAQDELTAVNNELMNHYYEYEYTLKQFIDFLSKKELALEKLRRELTRDYLNDPDFTPLNTISYLDELYAVEFDLLDLKQKLYLKLLKIYSLLDIDNIDEITYSLDFSNFFDKMAGNRAVYLWSNALQDHEPEFLAKYALNNEFDRLFFSQGELPDDVVTGFVGRYQRERGKVFKLIGNNGLAKEFDTLRLNEMVKKLTLQGFNGIQLDIEPHTFEDWEVNQALYLENLLKTVRHIRVISKEYLVLSISIPLFYPSGFVNQLEPLIDEVVLMCYERPGVESVVNGINEEVGLLGNKVSLAFRTADFEDRIMLEDFIKEIISATGINRIVVHDLDSLIRLDQRTILGK